ncbi:type IV pilin protein [Metabacillus sp. SLBN-84]
MFKKMLKNERGLTLIELLAVVVILGIIAAIAVPAIGNVISKSKEDAIHAEAVQVLDAAKLFVSTNNPTDTTKTYSNIGENPNTQMNDYLDGVGDYSITIGYANNKYTYTAIKVVKDNITRTYPTVADLREKDATEN